MMKKINCSILTLFCSLWVIAFSGCMRDDFHGDYHGETSVEIAFHIQSHLRTEEMGDAPEEVLLKHITLFAKGESSASWQRLDYDLGSVGHSAGYVVKRIALPADTYTFYAIANAPSGLLTSVLSVEDLKALLVETSGEPLSPLVMTAVSDAIVVNKPVKIDLPLTRLTARVDVHNKATNEFNLLSVQLIRAPNKSYLLPHTEGIASEEMQQPTDAQLVRYPVHTAVEQKVKQLYLYEWFNKDAFAYDKSVSLLVYGSYGKEKTKGYYRVDVTDHRGRRWVRRNALYQIDIKSVQGAGYATPEEALANKPINMVLGVTSRADEDETSASLVFDGEYFFGTSLSEIMANSDATYDGTDPSGNSFLKGHDPYEIVVHTDAPGGEWEYSVEGAIIDRSVFPDQDGDMVYMESWEWFTVERHGNKLVVNLIHYHDRRKNEDYDRMGSILISVKGRPNLTYRIPVHQRGDDSFYNRLDVTKDFFTTNGTQPETFLTNVILRYDSASWLIKEIRSLDGDNSWIVTDIPVGVKQEGDRSLSIAVSPLPTNVFYREAIIVLAAVPFVGDMPEHTRTIRIVSGLQLSYTIAYPENSLFYKELKRTQRVIETPLHQEKTYTYTVSVKTTQRWRVKASHPWITVTQPNFTSGSYNASFQVSVPVNQTAPKIHGLYKAREGYVDILGDQMNTRIRVYQGGYVEIGEGRDKTIWMDRNLRSSRFLPTTENINKQWSVGFPSSPREPWQVLYPAACPIAFPGHIPAAYAQHTDTPSDFFSQSVDKVHPELDYLSTYNPPYFYWFSRSGGGKPAANDGYFSFGMPLPYSTGTTHDSKFAWDENYGQHTKGDLFSYTPKKGDMDPCPSGWRVPSYKELLLLSRFLNRYVHHYASGEEDLQKPINQLDVNNGLFFYNEDKVTCWFPFSGYRNSYEKGNTAVVNQGVAAWLHTSYTWDNMNSFHLAYTRDYADMLAEENWFGRTIRCVRSQ